MIAFPALAQHGVRVRQRIQPSVQFSEKHARVLSRRQFRGKFRAAERLKCPVRVIQAPGAHNAPIKSATQTGSSQSSSDLPFQMRGSNPPHHDNPSTTLSSPS